MTPSDVHIATLASLIALLASCGGQKTAKTVESAPTQTSSASTTEQPVAQEKHPQGEPSSPAPSAVGRNSPVPQPAPSAPGPPQSIDEFAEESALQDIFFGPGRSDIERSSVRFMRENARWISENPSYLVLIEGHTDARGTSEARLSIADRRAKAAARFLLEEGVSNTRLFTISHGSERPACVETTDGCAARNRRVHFRVRKQ